MLTYCKVTNETLTTAMHESVIQVLYIYSYEHVRKILDGKNREQFIRQNGFSGM